MDDDRQVVRYLKKALEENGYAVTATTSGKQALAVYRGTNAGPADSGLEHARTGWIRPPENERSKFPYLRILVISGYLDGALLEAARILGAIATLGEASHG